jgi:hypothetical protein
VARVAVVLVKILLLARVAQATRPAHPQVKALQVVLVLARECFRLAAAVVVAGLLVKQGLLQTAVPDQAAQAATEQLVFMPMEAPQ